jgi:hypothetical protein
LLSYRDVVRENYAASAAGAGSTTKNFTAVAAGYVHVMTNIFAYNGTTATGTLWFYVYHGGVGSLIDTTNFYTLTRALRASCTLVLAASDYISIEFANCAAGDSLRGYIAGYKFLIAE